MTRVRLRGAICAPIGLGLALGAAPAAISAGLKRLCYARTYDAAHLAQHPKQRVTQIGAVVAEDATPGGNPFHLTIAARLRGHSGSLTSAEMTCAFYEPGGMQTGMAEELALADVTMSIGCDMRGGGAVSIARTAHGTGILKIEGTKHLALQGPCKDASCTDDLLAGPDDNGFLLDRTPDAVCAQMQKALP